MDTNILKYKAFICTVECGSFTRAASRLSYSQSGISRMISDLEDEWNVSLLERSRGGVRLTSDGLVLLPYAKSVCESYDELQSRVDELNDLQSGLIRIGTFSSVATHWLPGIIAAFQKDYPNIGYELLLGDYAEIEQWVMNGRVDCGFLRLPAGDRLQTEFLERDPLMAVVAEDHPLADAEVFPAEELLKSPFMLLEKGGRAEAAEVFDRLGAAPDVRFTTWDDYAIMSMVEKGLGISVLPALILRRAPYRIRAVKLDIPAYRDIAVAHRRAEPESLAQRRFMGYLGHRNDV